jgi:hypothetical protein
MSGECVIGPHCVAESAVAGFVTCARFVGHWGADGPAMLT